MLVSMFPSFGGGQSHTILSFFGPVVTPLCDMSRIAHPLLEQLAFLGVQCEMGPLEPLYPFSQFKLLVEHLAEPLSHWPCISKVLQDRFHQLLERCCSIAKDRGHNCELLQSMCGRECFILLCRGSATCEYPPFKCRVDNHLAPVSVSRVLLVLGSGKQSSL
jgi:hypothetical protein